MRLAPRGCREQRVVRETCDPHTLALGAASSRCPGRIAALEADNERLKVTPPPRLRRPRSVRGHREFLAEVTAAQAEKLAFGLTALALEGERSPEEMRRKQDSEESSDSTADALYLDAQVRSIMAAHVW